MSPKQSGVGLGAGAENILRLFRVRRRGRAITQFTKRTVAFEGPLQELIERHLLAFLNVRFLATEYLIGVRHAGHIDTLGIDREGSAVVVEYKRTASVNLIGQGLFYLDRLDDHRGEFHLLVQERLGATAIRREWNPPRFIFVPATFSPYDRRAVQQIGRRIELVQYSWFGDDLLALATLPAQRT